jgi:SSS family solute:Na+ symporter
VTIIDILIVIIYFLALITIGLLSSRKIKDEADFLVAGRRLGFGLYIPAMAAVVLGGASTFGSVALGYKYGISGMWLVVMIGFGILGMGVFFANRLSDLKIFSVSELLYRRFGNGGRFYSALIMTIYDMMVAVTAIIAIGVLFSSLLGWNSTISILIGGSIVICYTILGGMWAVTLTDVIQFWVMTVGLLLILLPVGFFYAGGFYDIDQNVKNGFLNIMNIGGKSIFSYFLLYFFGMMIGQDIWQRAFTGKNRYVIRKGTIWAGLYCIIYGIAGAIIGMSASVIVPNLADPQKALPEVILAILPTGFVGLVIAAILAAVMSTASGTLMASSTIIVNDFILPNTGSKKSEKAKINLTRIITLLVGVVAIFIASALQDIVVALDVAYALLSGSIFIPVIIALFGKKVSKKVVLTSMLISTFVVILDLIIEGITSLNPIIYGIIAGLVVILIGNLFYKPIKMESAEFEQVK